MQAQLDQVVKDDNRPKMRSGMMTQASNITS
jgi:hypothetical protein